MAKKWRRGCEWNDNVKEHSSFSGKNTDFNSMESTIVRWFIWKESGKIFWLSFGIFNRPKRNSISTLVILWFWGVKIFRTRCLGCRFQVWVQVQAPGCHLAITPVGCSRRQSKNLIAKISSCIWQHHPTWASSRWLPVQTPLDARQRRNVVAWDAVSWTVGQASTRVFLSWQQLLLAATGLLYRYVLPLLQYWVLLTHFRPELSEIHVKTCVGWASASSPPSLAQPMAQCNSKLRHTTRRFLCYL